jgi:hypothetical protein
MLKLCNKKLNPIALTYIKQGNLYNLSSYRFSSGGHGDHDDTDHSGHSHSEHSDHDQHHHLEAHETFQANPPLIDYPQQLRSRIFSKRSDSFSVDSILNETKKPLTKHEKLESISTTLFQTEKEYIDFLATNFERKAAERYPDYKRDESLKESIPEFNKLNRYQQEASLLDAYLNKELENKQNELHKMYQPGKQNSLEDAKAREHELKSNIY